MYMFGQFCMSYFMMLYQLLKFVKVHIQIPVNIYVTVQTYVQGA